MELTGTCEHQCHHVHKKCLWKLLFIAMSLWQMMVSPSGSHTLFFSSIMVNCHSPAHGPCFECTSGVCCWIYPLPAALFYIYFFCIVSNATFLA